MFATKRWGIRQFSVTFVLPAAVELCKQMKYYFCVTDGLKSFLLSILSLVKLACCCKTFSLIIYIGKGKHFIEKKSVRPVPPHSPPFCFVFHSYTISIRMKNSNPFLGVPSVSSNTLIKPNTLKREKQKKGDGRRVAGLGDGMG